ncbi:DDE-1 domain-containing protein, partial [Aphis craccivora]
MLSSETCVVSWNIIQNTQITMPCVRKRTSNRGTDNEVMKRAADISKDIKVPTYWTENKSAGVDWFKNFLKRNSTLSICQPESTSLARAINLNPVNANMFMDKYDSQLNKYKFEAHPTVLI